jgi:hypothetical protein
MTLVAAVTAVQTVARGLTGIKQAPTNAPESSAMFPFAVCYARTGTETPQSKGWSVSLHTLVCELHCSRQILPLAIAQALPLYEAFAAAILADPTLGGAVQATNQLRYTFGVMEYGGVPTIGYRVELDVKLTPTH